MTITAKILLWSAVNILASAINLDYSIVSIHSHLRHRTTNCTEIISHFMRRSTLFSPQIILNPFALSQAHRLDQSRINCQLSRLECIPLVVRDTIDVVGMPTTGGLKPLRNSYPEQNSPVIDRLVAEGAIVLGKTNETAADECRNPFDADSSSCGEGNGWVGRAIAVGAGVIGIGADSDGLAQVSASFNSLNSIRLVLNPNVVLPN